MNSISNRAKLANKVSYILSDYGISYFRDSHKSFIRFKLHGDTNSRLAGMTWKRMPLMLRAKLKVLQFFATRRIKIQDWLWDGYVGKINTIVVKVF